MKKRLLLPVLALILLLVAAPAWAHQQRLVGAYDITFGWHVEPAYVGLLNEPEFWVKSHDSGAPVTGLESTLHLMVHFGDQQKIIEIYPVEDDPGHYMADLIPTRPGDYGFHIFGKINDQDVDEQFTSADGQFDSVNPATDIMFPVLDATEAVTPVAGADIASLQAQIDALKAQIAQLTGTQTP